MALAVYICLKASNLKTTTTGKAAWGPAHGARIQPYTCSEAKKKKKKVKLSRYMPWWHMGGEEV
jgi:hypothetical protein